MSHRLSSPPQHDLGVPTLHVEKEAITAIANLSNNLLTHAASKSLARLRHRHPEVFKSKGVYYRALHLLQTCHYRSTVRAYILDLFDVPLSITTVREIAEAGQQIRQARRTAVTEAAESRGKKEAAPEEDGLKDDSTEGGVQTKRKTLTAIKPAYRMNGDTDSEGSEASDDDDKYLSAAKAQDVTPLVVLRGFVGA